ncbi:hypothetical protein UA08_07822 [Talaromyces atroroseus]|uniref:Uncharacterized protein n=1 Tax=Talaromyces atroroseus TaxID=1441469 RepID=A0A225A892_TALAT|nr:hypothetical protein UA08_07822 [Talaromyces atroroseus]OKL56951.1 hypothetical protein UA08_07822 [Talaromyces atroroseus]
MAIKTQTRIAPATDTNGQRIGNGLFATGNIHKGDDVLIVDAPFVAAVEEKLLKRVCSGCFDTSRPGKVDVQGLVRGCVRCKVVYYCDKTCQLKDWKRGHSLECPIYARLSPRVLPLNVRAVLRILLRQRSGKVSREEKDDYESFLELCFPDAKHARDGLDLFLLAKAVQEYGGLQELEQGFIASVFGRLDLNSFTLTSAFGNTRGVYLHPYTARFNHSCDYNATYSFDRGGKCYVKAIRPIQKDEQIFIPYTDSTFSVGTRRKELYERFKFQCNCSKCTHETNSTPETQIQNRAREEQDAGRAIDAIFKDYHPIHDAADVVVGGGGSTLTTRLTNLLHASEAKCDWETVSRQRQPLASIRVDLMGAQHTACKFMDLTLNAAIQHLRIDPGMYPDENHPVRRTNAFGFAQYAFCAWEGRHGDRSVDEADHVLLHAQLNLGVIVCISSSSSSRRLSGGGDKKKGAEEGEGMIVWPNPSFKEEAMRFLSAITLHCQENGIVRGREMDGLIMHNWRKLEVLVDATLRREMGLAPRPARDEDLDL